MPTTEPSIYATGNRWIQYALAGIDRALAAVIPPRSAPPVAPPRRVLVANLGHLGDVILSTAVLPVLRSAWPDCRIGLLVGSWSRMIVERHALVDEFHCFDHFRLNRSRKTLVEKIEQHNSTRRQTLRQIRQAGYDVAIDLRYYFANAIPLLWQAGIPTRIGYTSGGFGPMLTHPQTWRNETRHVVDYFASLLRPLPIAEEYFKHLRPVLAYADASTVLPPSGLRGPYIIIHMGTGAACKEWPVERWQQLCRSLSETGHRLVFTGGGKREERLCAAVAADLPNALNRCGQFSWRALTDVFRQAQLVIAVDSMAGHLAAAVDTPSVIISNGINHPAHWRPYHPLSQVLRHHTACAPCYRAAGCESMACVDGIEVSEVTDAVANLLTTIQAKACG